MASTRLSIFSHKLFRRTPDGPLTTGAFTVQIDALAPYFDSVTVCAPLIVDPAFRGTGFSDPRIELHPLPPFKGRSGFLRRAVGIRREILDVLERTDLSLVILPGYVGALASILCRRRRRRFFQWVVGDWGGNVRARRSASQVRRAASLPASALLDRLMSCLTRDTLTFYTGRVLYHRGGPEQHERVSSSIRASDAYLRPLSQAPSPAPALLYAGRLAAEKGLFHLLEALALLRGAGVPAVLRIVGAGELEDGLRRRIEALGLGGAVTMHGFVPHGPELYRHFRESDIFVLPSLAEQQGKVLLEAMIQSLPVVATSVGGIPSIVRDGSNGLLVPPADPGAIARAVRRIAGDGGLRRRLIDGGLETARAHTVEAETERMMGIIARRFGLQSKGTA